MSNETQLDPRGTGMVIRRLRTDKNMTQASLAYEADINVSYYCAVEKGANNITLGKFTSICNALDEPPDRVMSLILDYCTEFDLCQPDSGDVQR